MALSGRYYPVFRKSLCNGINRYQSIRTGYAFWRIVFPGRLAAIAHRRFKNLIQMYFLDILKEFNHSDGFKLSTDRSKLDLDFIHDFMTHSYWAEGISKEKVQTTIDNTLCFGLYFDDKQIGFTNVITDFSR